MVGNAAQGRLAKSSVRFRCHSFAFVRLRSFRALSWMYVSRDFSPPGRIGCPAAFAFSLMTFLWPRVSVRGSFSIASSARSIASASVMMGSGSCSCGGGGASPKRRYRRRPHWRLASASLRSSFRLRRHWTHGQRHLDHRKSVFLQQAGGVQTQELLVIHHQGQGLPRRAHRSETHRRRQSFNAGLNVLPLFPRVG
jgi:hypothetical protein